MKHIAIVAMVTASALALSACSPQPTPVVVAPQAQVAQPVAVAPAPVVAAPVYAQPAPVVVHDNSGANMAAGMMLGAALANTGPRTTVVQHTTVVRPAPRTVYVAPAPRTVYVAPARPAYVAPRSATTFTRSATTTSSVSSGGFRRR